MKTSKAVLVDITQCIGCGSCAVACKLWNGKEFDRNAPATGTHPVKAESNWTTVTHTKVMKDGESVWRFVKTQCMHCEEPACASACFAKALQKTEKGPVIYRPDLCVGCRYCMVACPFEVPKYEWGKVIPSLSKCQMCASRIERGDSPACTSACPTGAIRFGDREDLLRVAKEKLSTGEYVPHIYGETEAGGTSWLYLSDVPFESLGFKTNVPAQSLPAISENYMASTPIVMIGGAILFAGLSALTKRKEKVASEERSKDGNHGN